MKSSRSRPAVFLDRDGILNQVLMEGDLPRSPRHVRELRISEEVLRAVERLRSAGFLLLVVSNQPDVARGEITSKTVEQMNKRLKEILPVNDVYYCPHDSQDGCDCRKPKPGMILAGAREWGADLERSCLIGDRWVDVAAAGAAGIDGILLERPYSWGATGAGNPPSGLKPRFVGKTLGECVDFILTAESYATT